MSLSLLLLLLFQDSAERLWFQDGHLLFPSAISLFLVDQRKLLHARTRRAFCPLLCTDRRLLPVCARAVATTAGRGRTFSLHRRRASPVGTLSVFRRWRFFFARFRRSSASFAQSRRALYVLFCSVLFVVCQPTRVVPVLVELANQRGHT